MFRPNCSWTPLEDVGATVERVLWALWWGPHGSSQEGCKDRTIEGFRVHTIRKLRLSDPSTVPASLDWREVVWCQDSKFQSRFHLSMLKSSFKLTNYILPFVGVTASSRPSQSICWTVHRRYFRWGLTRVLCQVRGGYGRLYPKTLSGICLCYVSWGGSCSDSVWRGSHCQGCLRPCFECCSQVRPFTTHAGTSVCVQRWDGGSFRPSLLFLSFVSKHTIFQIIRSIRIRILSEFRH